METFEVIKAITSLVAGLVGLIAAFIYLYAYTKEQKEMLANQYLIIALLFLIALAL